MVQLNQDGFNPITRLPSKQNEMQKKPQGAFRGLKSMEPKREKRKTEEAPCALSCD